MIRKRVLPLEVPLNPPLTHAVCHTPKITLLFGLLTAVNAFAASLSLTSPRCEYRGNSVGVDTLQPRLNWEIESKERGILQSAYQVLVASSTELSKRGQGDLWDSGKVNSDDFVEIPAHVKVSEAKFIFAADDTAQVFVNGEPAGGKHRTWKQTAVRDLVNALKPGTNLLAIEADNGGVNSAGLIGKLVVLFADGETLAAPFFRKAFTVMEPIKRATAFASALGVYELRLNGKSVDTDVLSPGWTDFAKRVHYRGHDVAEQLKRGDNVVGGRADGFDGQTVQPLTTN